MRHDAAHMVITESASRFSHTHALIVITAMMACLTLAAFPNLILGKRSDRRQERRTYWSASAAASVCGFLGSLPDWRLGLEMTLFVFAGMSFAAYAYTPYIKIHGKIYAFGVVDNTSDRPMDGTLTPMDNQPLRDPAPDSYGGYAAATKLWWAMILFGVLIEVNFIRHLASHDVGPWELFAGIVLILMPISLGHTDGSWGYPISRKQFVQLGALTVMTAGFFGAMYLTSYYAGKRWPLRLNRSTEYLAHPRFRVHGITDGQSSPPGSDIEDS